MSADKDRAIRRQKQKRAKDLKKKGQQPTPARMKPEPAKGATEQKAE